MNSNCVSTSVSSAVLVTKCCLELIPRTFAKIVCECFKIKRNKYKTVCGGGVSMELLNHTWKMMPAVPTSTATVKIQRNRRSSTWATYFQSSIIWNEIKIMALITVTSVTSWWFSNNCNLQNIINFKLWVWIKILKKDLLLDDFVWC